MSLTIDTAYTHGRVVETMVNYGFGMPTRLVADGDVARWCGRLVAHYGGTKALVVLGGDKHTRDELVSAALGSLDRALLERVLFRCGSFEGDGGDELIDEAVVLATDEGVDFVLAIGDADTAGFARELARKASSIGIANRQDKVHAFVGRQDHGFVDQLVSPVALKRAAAEKHTLE